MFLLASGCCAYSSILEDFWTFKAASHVRSFQWILHEQSKTYVSRKYLCGHILLEGSLITSPWSLLAGDSKSADQVGALLYPHHDPRSSLHVLTLCSALQKLQKQRPRLSFPQLSRGVVLADRCADCWYGNHICGGVPKTVQFSSVSCVEWSWKSTYWFVVKCRGFCWRAPTVFVYVWSTAWGRSWEEVKEDWATTIGQATLTEWINLIK